MRENSAPFFRALSPLTLSDVSEQTVRLESAAEVVQLTVLAPDLFRLRITRGRKFSLKPSWAVAKTDWEPVPVKISTARRTVSLRTLRGRLSFQLKDGSWKVSDESGVTLFASVPRATGFAGRRSELVLSLDDGESLFGLGETTGTLDKRGLRRVFWNNDVLGHASAIHPSLQSLYLSIPFAISLRQGRAAGVFWDNPARQTWDLGQAKLDQWKLQAAQGEIDLYLFLGPLMSEVVGRFTELTGRMPMPPRWALGYHQCRYSYESSSELQTIARTFRQKRIPCDALYLDIHHMDGYRVFTFGKSFPKPAKLIAKLGKQGFKVVNIVDPGVKDDLKFGVLKRGKAEGAFVKDPGGKRDYIGKVWPGKSRFPDFTNARTRKWWGREQARLQKFGVAGFWNDMNEPANFALPSKALPENCVHHSDYGTLRHGAIHNVYGMQVARASREGALAQEAETRPFVITRAGYAGVQRYALAWTGDNSSAWEHLADSVQMLLNLGLSGMAFCGADVGGFLDSTTGELLARWTQFAAFTPFFRNHSNIGTHPQEPWAYGPKVEAICKRYIELRYRLLPYLYLLFLEAYRSGTPIMRPLSWHYQHDPMAARIDDQFLLGADLLVAPVLRQGATARSVYLPRGEWFDFWTREPCMGGKHVLANAALDVLPLYVRSGSLLPMWPVRQFVTPRSPPVVELHLWRGHRGALDWYEDDGTSLAHTRGDVHERRIEFQKAARGYNLTFSAANGPLASEAREWRVVLHPRNQRVTIRNRPLAIKVSTP